NLHALLGAQSARFVALISMDGQAPRLSTIAAKGLRESRNSRWQKTLSPALAALSPRIVERILSAQKPDESADAAMIKLVAELNEARAKECLSAASLKLDSLSEPVTVRLKTELEPLLRGLLAREKDTPLFLSAQLLAARLGLSRMDAAAVRARFAAAGEPQAVRLQALDALIAFRDPALLTAL